MGAKKGCMNKVWGLDGWGHTGRESRSNGRGLDSGGMNGGKDVWGIRGLD